MYIIMYIIIIKFLIWNPIFIFIDLKYGFGWIENFQSILIHFRLLGGILSQITIKMIMIKI